MRGGAKLKGADHSMLSRASNPEALGFLSGEVSLASKPEELLIAIARRCRKLIKKMLNGYHSCLGNPGQISVSGSCGRIVLI